MCYEKALVALGCDAPESVELNLKIGVIIVSKGAAGGWKGWGKVRKGIRAGKVQVYSQQGTWLYVY